MCSGSGCISISLASHLTNVSVRGFDISPYAIRLSRLNKRVINPNLDCEFHLADIMDDNHIVNILEVSKNIDSDKNPGYDLIICNPPYVKPSEYALLDPSVKDWEDPQALVTRDSEGMEFYKRILDVSPLLLRSAHLMNDKISVNDKENINLIKNQNTPSIVFETGSSQAVQVAKLMENLGYSGVQAWKGESILI